MVRESYINDVDEKRRGEESDFVIVVVSVGKKVGAVGEGIRAC